MRRLAAIAAILMLTACGGGGGGGGGATPSQPATSPPAQHGTAQLQIVFPSVGPTAVRGRMPAYASGGSQSIAIQINGAPVNPSSVSKVCNPAVPSGNVCTFSFPAPAGNDTFDIALGDADGRLLSEGTVEAAITANQTTVLHLTLMGLPSRVTLKFDTPNPPVGVPADVHLTAVAYDASGNQILGDPYLQPIKIRSSDTSGQITLSDTRLADPSSVITVHYSGKLMAAATFSSEIPTSQYNADAAFAPNPYHSYATTYYTFQVAADASGNAWFVECKYGNSGPCKVGKATPDGQVSETADVPDAYGIVAGPDGNMWFTENTKPYVAKIGADMQFTAYLAKSIASNEAYFAGPIVIGADGNMWFAEYGDIAELATSGQIVKRITTNCAWCKYLTVGGDGNFWLSGYGSTIIQRIAPDGTIASFTLDPMTTGPVYSNLVRGGDGQIYFITSSGLHKIAADGTMTAVTVTPTGQLFGAPFTLGPDNNIWGVDNGAAAFVTPGGALTAYPIPNAGISTTPDVGAAWGTGGNLWLGGANAITRFTYAP